MFTRQAELQRAGRFDPFEDHLKRPVDEHITAFESHLVNKGVSDKQVYSATSQVKRIVDGCKWKTIAEIKPGTVQAYLGDLRRDGRSAQTYNNYLRSIKQFTRWLVRDRRSPEDPLLHLSRLNVRTDRRHDRRALTADEFARLVDAARTGPAVESVSGADRAMMYVLAAWTGFRKGEIGSLTMRSFRLTDDPPTATVDACYSKRKRRDTQIVHPELARQLSEWIAAKPDLKPDDLLFRISGKVPGGLERKTNKMMQRDLQRARDAWIGEAKDYESERKRREESDFLKYENSDGLYADFHSNRHLFITSLERVGITPKMAQTLARHSDVRLTLGIYTHVGIDDQAAAIESLPAPPAALASVAVDERANATGTDGHTPASKKVPTVVPRGAKNGAIRLAPKTYQVAPTCTGEASEGLRNDHQRDRPKSRTGGTIRAASHQSASLCTDAGGGKREVHPAGLEPATFGSVDSGRVSVTANLLNDLRKCSEPASAPQQHPRATGSQPMAAADSCIGLGPPSTHDPTQTIPPNLVRVVQAWPSLPPHVQETILQLVDTLTQPPPHPD